MFKAIHALVPVVVAATACAASPDTGSEGLAPVPPATGEGETTYALPDAPLSPDGFASIDDAGWKADDVSTTSSAQADGSVGQVQQPFTNNSYHAFVWADRHDWPHGEPGYAADPRYSYNRYNRDNAVFHWNLGSYEVFLQGYASAVQPTEWLASVQVVAYGTNNVRCKLGRWDNYHDSRVLQIHCHQPDGNRADSKFVVQYDCPTASAGGLPSGYSWSCDDMTASSCTPSVQWSSKRSSGATTVTRTRAGRYRMFFPGFTLAGGNVQVTAAFGNNPNHCNTAGWFHESTGMTVYVNCNDTYGNAADSFYVVKYDEGVTSNYGIGAYLTASSPTLSSYTPSTTYSYNLDAWGYAAANRAGRYGVGRYWARHTGHDGLNSSVHVTARMTNGYCKVSNWYRSGSDVLVNTLCFDATGAPADATYSETYVWPFFTPS